MLLNVVINKAEDGWYVVECPTLPGCVSQGKSKEEALENIKEAIQAWFWAENQKSLDDSRTENFESIMVSV